MKEETQQAERFKPARAGKKRYILFELHSPQSKEALGREIWGKFLQQFGKEQALKMRISLIQFSRGLGILRCAHTSLEEAKGVLAGFGAKTVRVSGSLKKIRAKMKNS